MPEVVITTPFGSLCSMISRARIIALQKSGVNLLSGGLVKVRRYTLDFGSVQTTDPLEPIGSVNKAEGEAMMNP